MPYSEYKTPVSPEKGKEMRGEAGKRGEMRDGRMCLIRASLLELPIVFLVDV